jgi:hypothetical protein
MVYCDERKKETALRVQGRKFLEGDIEWNVGRRILSRIVEWKKHWNLPDLSFIS